MGRASGAGRSIPERYIADVASGRIVASQLVRQQMQRHLRDLETGAARGLVFDRKAAQRVIDFFAQFLCHTQGEFDGLPFVLEPWQQAVVWILYGWRRAQTGYRRYKFAYIEIARGQGKSAFASGLCIYELIAFGEAGAEVFSGATDKKTAKLVWDTAALMVRNSPDLNQRITIYRDNMHIAGTASKFEPCASEDTNLMGLRPSFICLDELHAHSTSGVWDVMISAMGKRRNPLLLAITNSGFDRHSVCWRQREYSEKVLGGLIDDDSWFAFIAGLDPEDDWEDERNWYKANPSLGTIVQLDDMRQQAIKAKADPSALNSFLRFRLSVWTSADTAWMPMHKWDECNAAVDEAALKGRPCYGGLDLSTTTDISAFVLLFPPHKGDRRWYILPRLFLPEEAIQERSKRDRVPYDVWARQGHFCLTPGNIIDYDFIRATVRELGEQYNIREIAFDRWNSSQLVTQLAADGFEMVKFGQGYESMNAPTKRILELALTGELAHGGHPVMRWSASNVRCTMDPAGNIKMDKAKSREKIDPMVALDMATGRAIVSPESRRSVYSERGILTL